MYNLRSIRVAYWNYRGALSKKGGIEKMLEFLDVLFLAETCVGPLHDFRVRVSLRIDSNQANIRRMIVLIRNPIVFSSVDLSSMIDDSFEVLGISFNNSRLFLLGTYRHQNVPASHASISSLSFFLDKHDFSMMLGDFNAHHLMWGGSRTNPAAHMLSKCIDDYHLVILNPPSSPTHVSSSSSSSSTIDLAIASPRISSLCDTRILPDLFGSDHYPVEVQVNCMVRTVAVFSYKIKLSKPQWTEVVHYLHTNAAFISQSIKDIDPDDPVSQHNTFMELVSASYENFSPSKPPPSSISSRASYTHRGPPPVSLVESRMYGGCGAS
ncbi:hypothetical protein ALC62_02263 [Cyphomyrmex costatus]|uniref:Endonuclease/exonuclease/phosphatase domain-containing protein n=1 Tax=Cyphomyrmex costatus TaxID=456900 RepID=A0A151IN55_9HYME|nr:hypothetical protein ALC62_02263 [Cyphomyrmex costatus]